MNNTTMKKLFTPLLALLLGSGAMAQTADTVSLGATYANDVYYSLTNDVQGSSPKNNWDIAFDASGFGSAIYINSATGTTLWKYPSGDISAWETADTTGISGWTAFYNSAGSWAQGAFDAGIDPTNQFDLGWGVYSMITHTVAGDSLYIIKLANGSYRKIKIDNLAGGAYNFTYANLNGTNEQTASVAKSSYTGKNFGYYSLQNNAAVDREPVSANWDLVFGQYTAFIPIPYTVTGVRLNAGATAVKVSDVADVAGFNDWQSQTFSNDITTIGYDWKAFTGAWVIEDSLLYFVKTKTGNVWKLVFSGFTGSGTGSSIFTKQFITTTSANDLLANAKAIRMYPNPSNGEAVHISMNDVAKAEVRVMDMTGKIVAEQTAQAEEVRLETAGLKSGMYLVSVVADGQKSVQKLVIR